MSGRGLLESWRRLRRGYRESNTAIQVLGWRTKSLVGIESHLITKPSISNFHPIAIIEPLRSFQSFHTAERDGIVSSLFFFRFVSSYSLPPYLFSSPIVYIIRPMLQRSAHHFHIMYRCFDGFGLPAILALLFGTLVGSFMGRRTGIP